MEDYKICSYYLSEKKEYKCISCGKLLDNNKVADVKEILSKLVSSYQSNSKIVDHIYTEKLNLEHGPLGLINPSD